jgi:hypothetical protein
MNQKSPKEEMDIISRNFFHLLCAGAFNEEVQIEPMSAWKWRRVYQYAMMHGVSALMYDGIEKCKSQFFLQLPDTLMDTWKQSTTEIEEQNSRLVDVFVELYHTLSQQQLRPILIKGLRLSSLYDHPEHRTFRNIEIFFPFQTQAMKAEQWARTNGSKVNDTDKYAISYLWNEIPIVHHGRLVTLTNKLLNHSLQVIVEKELREAQPSFMMVKGTKVEVVSNTLLVFSTLMRIARHMLTNGIPLKFYVDLGIILRKVGDKVDFVALQEWINKTKLTQIANISGLMLVRLFHFTEDEIPFLVPGKNANMERFMEDLFVLEKGAQSDWYFQQGGDIFVHASNSSAMMWHVQRSARYFRYYPSESVTNFFSSFAHSLSHIEE